MTPEEIGYNLGTLAPLEDLPPMPRGALGHVSDFLSLFDRPRALVAGAVSKGISEDPNQSAAGGAWTGLTGKDRHQWGDILGIPAPQSTDDWPSYIAKLVAHEAPDFVLDPLNLLFGAGAITKALKLSAGGVSAAGRIAQGLGSREAAKYLGGTSIGKALQRTTWGDSAPADLLQSLQWEAGKTRRTTDEATAAISARIQELGMNPQELGDVWQAAERPQDLERMVGNWISGTRRGPTEAAGLSRTGDEFSALVEQVRPLQKQSGQLFDEENLLLQQVGRDPIESLTSDTYQHMPHVRRMEKWNEPITSTLRMDATGQKGRTIHRWEHPDLPEGAIWGTEERVKRGIDGMPPSFPDELTKTPASLGEILDKGLMSPEKWVMDPGQALRTDIYRKLDRITFLKWLKEGEGKFIHEAGLAPEGFKGRSINIPGFEGKYVAEGQVANFLENKARTLFDPNTPAGAVNELLGGVLNTRVGRGIEKATDVWKTWALGAPGWVAGNVGANIPMAVSEGVNPLMLPYRAYQGVKARTGKGSEIIPGLPNKELRSEMAARDVMDAGLFGSEIKAAQDATKAPGMIESYLGPTAAQIAGYPRKVPEWFLKRGQEAEANAKLQVAIDKLTKSGTDFSASARATPEGAQAAQAAFDEAARSAHRGLLTYSRDSYTPMELNITKLFPFWGFNRGIISRTGELATTQPQKLANLGRFLDATMEPMSPQDKQIADPWIREMMPIKKILGADLGYSPDGLPNMALAGRFVPQGNLEQLMKRPTDALMSWLNPYMKAPLELMTNRNFFKDRPIDQLAGGFPGELVNPLIGGMFERATEAPFGMTGLPSGYSYMYGLLPQNRALRSASELGRGAGLWGDPYKAPTDPESAAAWYMTGGKLYPYDMAKYLKNRGWEATQREARIKSDTSYSMKRGAVDDAVFYQKMLQKALMQRLLDMGGAGLN